MKKKYAKPICEAYTAIIENNLMSVSVGNDMGEHQGGAPDDEKSYLEDDYIVNDAKKHHSFSAWDTWDD